MGALASHFKRAARRDWKFLAGCVAVVTLGVAMILVGGA